MAIDFPNNPNSGDTFSVGNITWRWNGYAWNRVPDPGAKGEVGQKGQKGEVGLTGSVGQKGEKGDVEQKGNKGEVGEKGATGAQGPQGATGPQGNTGPQGAQGIKGQKGDTGPQGPQGEKGATGAKGDKGAVGPQGPQGAQGPTGPQGDKGQKGQGGTTGGTGPTGPQGSPGADGSSGPPGPTGPQGPSGSGGATGPTGPPGPSGTDASLPAGVIVAWSGSQASIPSGWVLCNGSNSTPDLRNRFIVGAGSGSNYTPGNTGGSDSVTLTTAQMPSHTHSDGSLSASQISLTGDITKISECYNVAGGATGVFTKKNTGNSPVTGSASNSPTAGVDFDASHSHPVSGSTGSNGSGNSHENRPPYYALCWIMKT